jgi:hypothetical protein
MAWDMGVRANIARANSTWKNLKKELCAGYFMKK